MDIHSPKVVQMLKQQRRFHREQLRLIDIALNAIESAGRSDARDGDRRQPLADPDRKHRIPWTKEIDRLLDDYDEFNIIDLQNDLAEKRGIPSATSIQGRNVISNTLSRLIKRGRIQKVRPGVYRVVTEALTP